MAGWVICTGRHRTACLVSFRGAGFCDEESLPRSGPIGRLACRARDSSRRSEWHRTASCWVGGRTPCPAQSAGGAPGGPTKQS